MVQNINDNKIKTSIFKSNFYCNTTPLIKKITCFTNKVNPVANLNVKKHHIPRLWISRHHHNTTVVSYSRRRSSGRIRGGQRKWKHIKWMVKSWKGVVNGRKRGSCLSFLSVHSVLFSSRIGSSSADSPPFTTHATASDKTLNKMKITALLVLKSTGDGSESVFLANASDVSHFGYFQRHRP
jgi:hypothetical protein